MTSIDDLTKERAWEEAADARIIAFECNDGVVWGFPIAALKYTRLSPEENHLVLEWPESIITIIGPAVKEFFRAFQKHRVLSIREDTTTIVLVRHETRAEAEAEADAKP